MRAINSFLDWILYTSIFAGCCAVSMCLATERLLLGHMPALHTLHLFIFCSTLVVYNAHYIARRLLGGISEWKDQFKTWRYLFFGGGMLGCLAGLLMLPAEILYSCVVMGALSFAYSLPLLPFKSKRRLKDYGWVKITSLTGVWAIVTSVLPILYWDRRLSAYPFEIIIRFVFLFTLCIAFDIRDMQTDKQSGIYTLPNRIGLRRSYQLMDVFLILFCLLSIIQYLRYPSEGRLVAEFITALVTKAVLVYTRRNSSDRVYLGLVDGMMLLYGLLVALQ